MFNIVRKNIRHAILAYDADRTQNISITCTLLLAAFLFLVNVCDPIDASHPLIVYLCHIHRMTQVIKKPIFSATIYNEMI